MATVKEYETVVKKIRDASEGDRGDLVQQKNAIARELRKKAGGSHDKRRRLKFEMDEANNS